MYTYACVGAGVTRVSDVVCCVPKRRKEVDESDVDGGRSRGVEEGVVGRVGGSEEGTKGRTDG